MLELCVKKRFFLFAGTPSLITPIYETLFQIVQEFCVSQLISFGNSDIEHIEIFCAVLCTIIESKDDNEGRMLGF